MDFPFLLEQFRNEFNPSKLEILIPEDEEYEEYEYKTVNYEVQRDSQMVFVVSGLQNAILVYSKIFESEMPSNQSNNIEDLLESLRSLLEKIRRKYKSEGDAINVLINGGIELYLLVRDISRFHEEKFSDLQAEIYEFSVTTQNLQEKCEKLADENETLLYHLASIENKAMKTTEAHTEILEKKKNLEIELEKAEDKYKDIQSFIKNKEQAILKLEKEIRQLNSFKAIQEMRDTRDDDYARIKSLRGKKKIRKSVPNSYNFVSPKLSAFFGSPKNDFRLEFEFNQLKVKNELAKKKENELNEFSENYETYMKELDNLKDENLKLNQKLRENYFNINFKLRESRESLIFPSLFDEMQQILERNTSEANLKGDVSPFNHNVTHSHKETQIVLMTEEKITQTKPINIKTRNSCLSCF